jgi:hypothetical protein
MWVDSYLGIPTITLSSRLRGEVGLFLRLPQFLKRIGKRSSLLMIKFVEKKQRITYNTSSSAQRSTISGASSLSRSSDDKLLSDGILLPYKDLSILVPFCLLLDFLSLSSLS